MPWTPTTSASLQSFIESYCTEGWQKTDRVRVMHGSIGATDPSSLALPPGAREVRGWAHVRGTGRSRRVWLVRAERAILSWSGRHVYVTMCADERSYAEEISTHAAFYGSSPDETPPAGAAALDGPGADDVSVEGWERVEQAERVLLTPETPPEPGEAAEGWVWVATVHPDVEDETEVDVLVHRTYRGVLRALAEHTGLLGDIGADRLARMSDDILLREIEVYFEGTEGAEWFHLDEEKVGD